MQTRYDLLVGYAALFGLIVVSLIIPIPSIVNLVAIPVLVTYLACHQGAQTTREAQPYENTRRVLRKGDSYLLVVLVGTVFVTSFLVFILPSTLSRFLFKLAVIIFGTFTLSQRIATIVVGCCTEENEHTLRQRAVKMDLKGINKTLRPIVQPLHKTLESPLELISVMFRLVFGFIEVFELIVARLLDGTEEGTQMEKFSKEASLHKSTAPPLPSSTSVGTTCIWNLEDEIPWLPPSLISIDGVNIIAYVSSIVITLLYIITGFWFFNNLIVATICLYLIELINLGSLVDGFLVLVGFFLVEFLTLFTQQPLPTDPIQLAAYYSHFTANIPFKFIFSHRAGYSMLGLGPIVIPALFLSLSLRYDIFSSKPFKPAEPTQPQITAVFAAGYSGITISTPFFNLGLASVGLASLLSALISASTPSTHLSPLLITVPLLIATTAGVAFVIGGRDEIMKLVAFVDAAAEPAQTPSSPSSPSSPAPSRTSMSSRTSINALPSEMVRMGATLPGEPQTITE